MTDFTLNGTFDDEEVERIAKATAHLVDRATEILVDLIMAAREGDDEAFAKAKIEGEQLLGIGDDDA